LSLSILPHEKVEHLINQIGITHFHLNYLITIATQLLNNYINYDT